MSDLTRYEDQDVCNLLAASVAHVAIRKLDAQPVIGWLKNRAREDDGARVRGEERKRTIAGYYRDRWPDLYHERMFMDAPTIYLTVKEADDLQRELVNDAMDRDETERGLRYGGF